MFPESFLSFQAFFLFRKIFSLSDASDKFSFFPSFLPFRKPFSLGSLIFQFLTSLSDASGEFFSLFRAFFLFRKPLFSDSSGTPSLSLRMFPKPSLSFRTFFFFRKVFSLFRMLSISSLFSSLLPFRKSFLFGFFRNPSSLFRLLFSLS